MKDFERSSVEIGHQYTIIDAVWPRDKEKLFAIRHQVFVVEQEVPEDEEWVGDDDQFDAVLAIDFEQTPIGTGRLSKDGTIGRMAVLEKWRGRGIGSAILQHLVSVATKNGLSKVKLSAQLQALKFYERHGFVAEGEVYLDAGIEHRSMSRVISGHE